MSCLAVAAPPHAAEAYTLAAERNTYETGFRIDGENRLRYLAVAALAHVVEADAQAAE